MQTWRRLQRHLLKLALYWRYRRLSFTTRICAQEGIEGAIERVYRIAWPPQAVAVFKVLDQFVGARDDCELLADDSTRFVPASYRLFLSHSERRVLVAVMFFFGSTVPSSVLSAVHPHPPTSPVIPGLVSSTGERWTSSCPPEVDDGRWTVGYEPVALRTGGRPGRFGLVSPARSPFLPGALPSPSSLIPSPCNGLSRMKEPSSNKKSRFQNYCTNECRPGSRVRI